MSQNYNVPFITYDEALASALIMKGYQLQSCRYAEAGKSYFTFHGSKQLRESIELYWEDKLFLNARTLLKTYQDYLPITNNRKQ